MNAVINFWLKYLPCTDSYQTVRVNDNGSELVTIVTALQDMPEYNLQLNTEFSTGVALLFLSDADIREGAKLLLELEKAVVGGKISPYPNLVLSFSREYFMRLGFSGLVFLDPEDMEIFDQLKLNSKFLDNDIKCLTFLLLKKEEMFRYSTDGFNAILDSLSEGKRDFLSVGS